MRGVIVGVLTLTALGVLVQPESAGRVAGIPGLAGAAVRWFVSPAVPGIPDRRKADAKPAAADAPPAITYPDPSRPPNLRSA